jgi:hypothetical protein
MIFFMKARKLGRKPGICGEVALFSLAVALLPACGAGDPAIDGSGDDTVASTAEPLITNCSTGVLSSIFLNHTCTHVSSGPFISRSATAIAPFPWFGHDGAAPFTPPASTTGRTHVYYDVTLPSAGGGSYSGTVRFKPLDTGDHAFFVSAGTYTVRRTSPAAFLTADGGISPNPGSLTCSSGGRSLTNYQVFNLDNSKIYEVTFTATVPLIGVGFERVADWIRTYYQDADGDGYGSTSNPPGSIQTACQPPSSPFSNPVTQPGDCNDANPAVYPGAGCP